MAKIVGSLFSQQIHFPVLGRTKWDDLGEMKPLRSVLRLGRPLTHIHPVRWLVRFFSPAPYPTPHCEYTWWLCIHCRKRRQPTREREWERERVRKSTQCWTAKLNDFSLVDDDCPRSGEYCEPDLWHRFVEHVLRLVTLTSWLSLKRVHCESIGDREQSTCCRLHERPSKLGNNSVTLFSTRCHRVQPTERDEVKKKGNEWGGTNDCPSEGKYANETPALKRAPSHVNELLKETLFYALRNTFAFC